MTGEASRARARRAAIIVFVALLALYLASLAPHVTFWDAGEFIAAIESWGIPHPPGTPLYVTVGRAVRVLFSFLPAALVVNALSAILTAAACALGGALLVRRGARLAQGIGAGICAGCLTTVWLSATEAEVYSASLLLAALMLTVAERAGTLEGAGERTRAVKARALLVYLFALAATLHPSALVAGPGAIWLAVDDGATSEDRRIQRWWRGALLSAALVAAGGLATGRFALALIGGAVVVALAIAGRAGVSGRRGAAAGASRAILALALGATPLAIMLLRARLDPAINQGNPATWHALADEIARRQYDVAPLWPRQAPAWIQLANFFQYSDWQAALGLAPESTASIPRLVVSIVFVALGTIGARAHYLADRRSFRAMLVLLLGGSLGVIAYLNLKAGPSIGWGILPDSAPHEARERDYFFVLAFWTWGLWAGYGAVAFAARETWLVARGARARQTAVACGLALAALPALLNWRAMNRRREPDASTASLLADALLTSVPPNGVLVVWGDNDSYPLWEAQQARRIRRDVTVVTSPLLGAGWYRDELRRRWRIDAGALAPEATMVARTVASAHASRRPVAIAVTVPAEVRTAAGKSWSLCGVAWTDPGATCSFAGADSLAEFLTAHPAGRFTDITVRAMTDALRCAPLAARAAPDSAVTDSLAGACNTR